MPNVSDWMRFKCGDKVFRADDPRHVGRVMSITSGNCVKVKWDDNGINSHIPLADALDKSYCGRLIKVRQLPCGCITDGSVVCFEHIERM